ncbi:MAG: DUF2007 domain-containing protein [Salinivirgaceae bacterium]|nr:DUF2007 domain-containing protein [Salinivirgaceae bacterium]
MQFITIKESHNATDLLVLKSKLESEGISCYLKDELTTQVLNYIPAMTVELQVADKDIERVKEIMEEIGEKLVDYKTLICPNCDSENIKVKNSFKNAIKILTTFFITIITFTSIGNIFKKVDYKCMNCDHEFRDI